MFVGGRITGVTGLVRATGRAVADGARASRARAAGEDAWARLTSPGPDPQARARRSVRASDPALYRALETFGLEPDRALAMLASRRDDPALAAARPDRAALAGRAHAALSGLSALAVTDRSRAVHEAFGTVTGLPHPDADDVVDALRVPAAA